jgi:SAM-dependent methyltransferase
VERTPAIVCPHCLGKLIEKPDLWHCNACQRSYRALRGIPDLRTADDEYLANDRDWEFAAALSEAYDRLDFRGILERYFDHSPDIPTNLRERQITHILTAPERASRWLDLIGGSPRNGALLDLGCGTGSFLSVAASCGASSVGLDIAMRWLLVAQKRIEEEELTDCRLVCACAERLPFRDQSFHRIVAGDVIEHVANRERTLDEAHRVLVPGGRAFLASPNRFSLAPEPHVQVWGVGFLPRPWMAPYVRWRRGLDFRAIHNLGYIGWRRLLRRSRFTRGDIRCPQLPESDLNQFHGLKRQLGRLYDQVVTSGPGQALARAFGPLFHVVCERPLDDTPGPTPSRATRRRSTPSTVPE